MKSIYWLYVQMTTTGKTTSKPDPVVVEFDAELEMLRMSRREMRQLVEARMLHFTR